MSRRRPRGSLGDEIPDAWERHFTPSPEEAAALLGGRARSENTTMLVCAHCGWSSTEAVGCPQCGTAREDASGPVEAWLDGLTPAARQTLSANDVMALRAIFDAATARSA